MIHGKIRKGSPQRNVPNEGGLVFLAIVDQYVVISRKLCILHTNLLWDEGLGSFKGEYLENRELYTQSYYRTVIGNHMQAIKWCHFR